MQPTRNGTSIVLACVAALGASVLVSACASSSAPTAGGSPFKNYKPADAVKFVKCLREHGVKAEVSTNEGGVQIGLGSPGETHAGGPEAGGKPSLPPGFEAAQSACKKYAPNEGKPPKLSPAEEAKEREAALKFSRCMRSHGVEVTDSASGTVEIPSSVDQASAIFQDAQKDCQGMIGNSPLRMSSRGPGGEQFQSTRVGGGGGE